MNSSLLKKVFCIFILIYTHTSYSDTFQAENYDESFDTSPGNIGGAFRGGDVDIEPTSDSNGGFNVGWIDAGEWLVFHNFTVPVTGRYTISLRVASVNGATASVDLNAGSIPLGNFSIPATGGWQNWITLSQVVTLNAGTYHLGIFAHTSGWNLNWISMEPAPISSSSSSSAASSSTNSSASSKSSLSATNADRSLFVHDEATIQAADFNLRSTLQQLVNQLNAFNPSNPTSVEEFFARMWDTQNPAPGLVAGGEKCTRVLNGFSVACRQAEGQQASNPQAFIASYRPLALVNRFDLRDKVNFNDCGEYRIIYSLIGAGGGQRNFIIFESQLPNPQPGNAAGCLPIAQFWQNLSNQNDAITRAQALHNFYFNGIASANVRPVIDFRNYVESSGQIRANMFMSTAWNLKEFKIAIDTQGLSLIKSVFDQSNPVNFLFGAQSGDPRVAQFQNDFVNNLNSLLGDFNSFTLMVANDQHNRGESFASTAMAADSILSTPFFSSPNNAFRQAVSDKIHASGSNLTSEQVIARATAMTCAGCHAPSNFGLTGANAVGPNQSWPDTLGFTHINELSSNGIFPISPALTNVFLPARIDDLRNFLTSIGATANVTKLSTNLSRRKLTPTITPTKTVKRSG